MGEDTGLQGLGWNTKPIDGIEPESFPVYDRIEFRWENDYDRLLRKRTLGSDANKSTNTSRNAGINDSSQL
jgi:hypothetical protein